ncbi:NAD-dependent epimerase/dehydratase family protein [Conexibacter sp. SYSU D00693]|uniref:NAD-dependent epimerase/dehydratase family protein n=1 Tax=Conexibacter sp. SYSU D00693 TaxID=2812560 RepID=UPI00196A4181|nr:NAD-dependent epimerase/dehydratase family protein [Conexibacter sp. SYSU D00693]
MRALVTGGAGFIGSNLVDALVDRGDEVAVLDDLSSGKEANIAGALERGAVLHRADIRDAAGVQSVMEQARPEVVFHLAAQMDVRRSIEDPAFDALTNVVGTINVLEAARNAGARRLVNTSTGGAIYGDVDQIPTPETIPPQPMAPYGQSKFCAEEYLRWARRLYGFETVTLRYGNVFGPRQDPSGDAGVIAIFTGRALRGERPTIFGDGLQTRDYVFVGDIVQANLLAAEHPAADGSYNVGTGTEATILDLVAALKDAAGLGDEFEPEFAPARTGELQRSCLDVARAQRELGFRAAVSLQDGIARTLAWARDQQAA